MRNPARLAGHAEDLLAGAGLVVVVAVTAFNIVNRYLLRGSAAWAPELAGMVFAWVVFLGASAAWRRGMHISIDLLVRQLPRRGQAAMRIATGIGLAVFFAYATYLAVRITLTSHSRLTPVMRVPFSYVYASAAVAFALMALRTAAAAARELAGRRSAATGAPWEDGR